MTQNTSLNSFTRGLALLAIAALIAGGAWFAKPPDAAYLVGEVLVTNSLDETNNGDGCSLREAIMAVANAADYNECIYAGVNAISFNIGASGGPQTISPSSALPDIATRPVTIDGTSQPGCVSYPCIELDGSGAGAGGVNGLKITAGGSTVQGLVINRFSGHGIYIATAGGNTIQGNYIGTDVNGTTALSNTLSGVYIDGTTNNTVGGTTAAARNIISGNGNHGVRIENPGATGNKVIGNYIGTDVNGAAKLGNTQSGVYVFYASNNTIGGTEPDARNVISGNGEHGVYIGHSGATGNQVIGNYIGTDVTGTQALGNTQNGVHSGNSPNNTIGPGNIISSNYIGVYFQSWSASGNKVIGNYIGTDVTGTLDRGNRSSGVFVDSARNNTIGGTGVGERNLISGNEAQGVYLYNNNSTGNRVIGNYIGTDVNGTAKLGNAGSGVLIVYPGDNTIGGTAAAERNVISGNGGQGVFIYHANTNATGNRVQGNYIGTDANGTTKLGNVGSGVTIGWSFNSTIGGMEAGARNLISGNGSVGVLVYDIRSTGNRVQGNYIGTDVNGTANLGNSSHGVLIDSAPNNIVGGTATGEPNIIAYNSQKGVVVIGSSATGNRILSNSVFTNTQWGIDLGDNGVTANDDQDPDTGSNNLQNYPVLTSAVNDGTNTTLQGTLNSTPNTNGFTLQFFSNDACDSSGYGEGQTHLDQITVNTDGSGNASFSLVNAVPAGKFVTTTATDPNGNTSEFSQCRLVNRRPVADAGTGGPVDQNVTVTLDGSKSSDPDGDSLIYGWKQTGGLLVTLSNPTAVSPTFTSPHTPGVLTFTLTVTDEHGLASTPDEVVMTVINNAPVRTGASALLTAVDEDNANPPGATTSALFSGLYGDADGDPFAGVAVVSNAATASHGRWQYSTDGGTIWADVSSGTSDTNALVMGSSGNDRLRFLPAANYNGTPGSLTVRLWDGSSGAAGAGQDLSGIIGGGGAFSDDDNRVALDTSVTPINDAPEFTPGGEVTVNEDAGPYDAAWATDIRPGPATATDEAGQVLTFTVTNDNHSLFAAQPEIDKVSGNLSFTPAADVTGSAAVTVTLLDSGGTANGGVDTSAPQPFTITVRAAADLGVSKQAEPPSAVPGWSITYTLVVTNAGPSDVGGAILSDALPAEMLNPTWKCAAIGTACPAANGDGTINALLDLPEHSVVIYTITGTLASGAMGNLANTASVTLPGGVLNLSPDDDTASVNTTLTPQADLAIRKTSQRAGLAGTPITYTIVVRNLGPSDAPGTGVTDDFPAGMGSPIWNCVRADSASCGSGSGNIDQTVDLAAGEVVTYTARGTMTNSDPIANTARVAAPSGVTDPDTETNQVSVDVSGSQLVLPIVFR